MGAYQTVVVGTDGSDSSYLAVERAAEVAQGSAAKLVIVCAYAPASRREVASASDALGEEAYQVVGSTHSIERRLGGERDGVSLLDEARVSRARGGARRRDIGRLAAAREHVVRGGEAGRRS